MACRKRRYLTPEEIAAAKPHELVLAFDDLAIREANKVRENCEDTRQDARVGLVKAAERYDSTKGAFVPYAVLWIKQAINRGVGARPHLIHIPELVRTRMNVVLAAVRSMPESATSSDIAYSLGGAWTEAEVDALLSLPQASAQSETFEGVLLEDRALDAAASRAIDVADARMDLLAIARQMPAELAADIIEWLDDSRSDARMRKIIKAVNAHLADDQML